MRARATPGWDGYVVAVFVSIAVTALGLVLVSGVLGRTDDGGGLFENLRSIPLALLVAVLYVGIVSVPFVLVGVPVVHLLCRRVPRQWVHVLAAGAAGLVSGLVFAPVAATVEGLVYWPWMVGVIGLAAAAGRVAVIPMCPSVHAPVDDDSPRGAPAR